MAEMSEMARLQEPSVMRPEFRQLDEAAKEIQALEDEAIASGIDFEDDIAPLRGEFFQAVDSAGTLSGDEKQILRDKYSDSFTKSALDHDERALKKADREIAVKQAEGALWKQEEVRKASEQESETMDKLDKVEKDLHDWLTDPLDPKNPTLKEIYAQKREFERTHGIKSRDRNTDAYKADAARRDAEYERSASDERTERSISLQESKVLAESLAHVKDTVDPKTGEVTESAADKREKVILKVFPDKESNAFRIAKGLAALSGMTFNSQQAASAAAARKAYRAEVTAIEKDLDSLGKDYFAKVKSTFEKGNTINQYFNMSGEGIPYGIAYANLKTVARKVLGEAHTKRLFTEKYPPTGDPPESDLVAIYAAVKDRVGFMLQLSKPTQADKNDPSKPFGD